MSRFPRFAPQAVAMLLGLIVTLAGTDAAAASTEADQLREELRALKAENARQAELMRALEERIRALEKARRRLRLKLRLRLPPPKRWLP